MISTGKATLYELQTVYGVEDAFDWLEIAQIDSYNERLAAEAARSEE